MRSKDEEVSIVKPLKLSIGLLLILLNFLVLSCSSSEVVKPEDQAKIFLTLLQNNNINKAAEMVYQFQANMAKLQNEPQFKKDEFIAKSRNEIKEKFLNEQSANSIVYLFRFPCQWQILETKQLTEEVPDMPFTSITLNRIYAVVKYNSMPESPDSVPVVIKEEAGFKYKVKEIFFHCDFEKNTGLYLNWGLDKHTPW